MIPAKAARTARANIAPGLNTSIMLHLGTALRAYYDGLSSPPVPHDVINAAVPVDRQPRALSAYDHCELRLQGFDLGRRLHRGEQKAILEIPRPAAAGGWFLAGRGACVLLTRRAASARAQWLVRTR